MIKGVNKNIIEINNPDSIYFEKAIFYLRPGVRELPGEVSSREISRYVEKLGLYAPKYKPSHKYGWIMLAVICAVSIAAVIWVFMH